ncbi:hypothetical protein ES705_39060 [subsurface metagenome]|jgi:hypothetical protein
MKVCPYARQQCKWPDKGCPREEELRPIFASKPEIAVSRVWSCEWSGSRLTAASYLMHLIKEQKLKV